MLIFKKIMRESFGSLIHRKKKVIVCFFTSNSPDCLKALEVINMLEQKTPPENHIFRCLNSNKNYVLSEALRINHLPTILIYENGILTNRLKNPIDYQTLEKLI